jgi:hypothetical protein
MKQTAVDWLFKKMDVIGYSDIPTSVTASKEVWGQIYKKAKEMEEGQIALAYSTGTLEGVNQNFTNGYTYYEKTYKWYK